MSLHCLSLSLNSWVTRTPLEVWTLTTWEILSFTYQLLCLDDYINSGQISFKSEKLWPHLSRYLDFFVISQIDFFSPQPKRCIISEGPWHQHLVLFSSCNPHVSWRKWKLAAQLCHFRGRNHQHSCFASFWSKVKVK